MRYSLMILALACVATLGCRTVGSDGAASQVAGTASQISPAERDFVTPAFDIVINPGAGARPTLNDVTIRKGFDGRGPDEVAALVRAREQETMDTANVAFVDEIIRDVHKRWTIAIQNVFVPQNNPAKTFVDGQLSAGARVIFVGVMSAVNGVWVRTETAGVVTYYRNDGGSYKAATFPRRRDGGDVYHVIMEAEVRQSPQAGVKLRYPAWSDPRLTQPIRATIIEGK